MCKQPATVEAVETSTRLSMETQQLRRVLPDLRLQMFRSSSRCHVGRADSYPCPDSDCLLK